MILLLSMEDVDVDKMRQLLWEEDVAQIPSILIFFTIVPSFLCWHYSKIGQFSIKCIQRFPCHKCASLALTVNPSKVWWKKLSRLPSKIKIFILRVFNFMVFSQLLSFEGKFLIFCGVCVVRNAMNLDYVLSLSTKERLRFGLSCFLNF